MSLNLSKLEKLFNLGNGAMRARCPACAAAGQDRTGEHLRIAADGRFGCCIHPKDREHRKKIFALAGERSRPQPIRVRVAAGKSFSPLGRLGRVFASPSAVQQSPDASDGVANVQELIFEARTARTGVSESNSSSPAIEANPISANSPLYTMEDQSRTARTLVQYSSICTDDDKKESTYNNGTYTQEDYGGSVRAVREDNEGQRAPNTPNSEKLPFFTPGGTLVIPFDSPERYHWWKSGQSVTQTKQEILERMKSHDTTV